MNEWIARLTALAVRPWLLAFSLLLLHLGLLQGVTTPVGRGLIVGHLGSVLLWQPLVRQDRKLGAGALLAALVIVAGLGLFMSWGLALLWMLVLAGLIGAELFRHPVGRERMSFWCAEAYLIVALVALTLPQLLPVEARPTDLLGNVVSLMAPLLLMLVPTFVRKLARTREQMALDFVGGLVIVLVLSGVLLGALALMFVSGLEYIPALLQSLGIMAICLLLLGWAWNPGQGAGLSLAIARHALSGGAPFSHWLDEVARLATGDNGPEVLLEGAVTRMLAWPGIEGADWRVIVEGQEQGGFVGRIATRRSRLQHGAVEIGLHTRYELAPMHLWQMDLMVRLLSEFHAAKEQSRRLQSLSYLRAVHETGARMTHEVKNLLQSIDTLCFAMAQAERDGRSEALQSLLSRQLPMISQRLHEALERIRQPEATDVREGDAEQWWLAVRERLSGERVVFELDGNLAGARLPVLLFDTVAENLVRNALDKPADKERGGEAPNIRVTLKANDASCVLQVEDDGVPLDGDRADLLFVRPLPSDRGLGIGLYQASRLAESLDYRLYLAENKRGCVRFELARTLNSQV
ncbi:ATP-binding protein [Uliginosibacterium sp. H3]|uniref:ATP-binding protein n=1 Tax=Uliginosibacterium silvisoli TaxID=3114758 RepID=A0ABU6K536_9RHOO|nr:ATP-binding protein [Uliginosibacterium sp. H3]